MIQQEMLQYQQLDKELTRIEKELRKNDFYLKRKQFKAKRVELEEKLTKLDAKAGELKTQLAVAKSTLQKIADFIGEQTEEMAHIQDEAELTYMSKKLTEQIDLLNNSEREIKRILKEGEEVAKLFDEINKDLPKIVAGYKKCDEEFAKATEEVKPKVAELKQKQAELKKVIDAKLFEMYKKLSDSQINPVFVPLLDGVRCGGCRMDMPKGVIEQKISATGYMICEHCGRIIYQEQ